MFQILLLSVCYVIAFYSSTLLAKYSSPFLMIGTRFLFSGCLVIFTELVFNRRHFSINTKYKSHYIIATTFGFIIPFIIGSTVINSLPAVDSSIIAVTAPILIYILSALFFKTKLGNKQLLFLFLGTLISFIAIIAEASAERVSLISWQEPLVLFISILYGIGWLSIGRLVMLKESESAIMGLGFMATGIISMIVCYIFEKPWFDIDFYSIALFLIIVVFGDLIVTRTRAKLSHKYSQAMLSLINIFAPFIIALHENIFDNAHFSLKFFLILIPSMACFVAFYREEIKPPKCYY
jgi:drug/metabolite transporter (DMT)-like permease